MKKVVNKKIKFVDDTCYKIVMSGDLVIGAIVVREKEVVFSPNANASLNAKDMQKITDYLLGLSFCQVKRIGGKLPT